MHRGRKIFSWISLKEQQGIIEKEYHKTDAGMSIEGFLELSKEDAESVAGVFS